MSEQPRLLEQVRTHILRCHLEVENVRWLVCQLCANSSKLDNLSPTQS